MPIPSAPVRGTWAAAAADLARRVNRRARLSALLGPVAAGLLAGGLGGLAYRLFLAAGTPAADRTVVLGCLGGGLLGGLLVALGRPRRAPEVGAGDAAWALDRLQGADGRGLAAAAAAGAAGAEAGFGPEAPPPPPRVRLQPPRGLVLTVTALFLGVLALLAPSRAPGAPHPGALTVLAGGDGPGVTAAGESAGEAAAAADARAATLDRQAAEARRIREILNLPPSGPLDPDEVARRLAEADRRRKAAAATTPGSRLSELLAGGDTASEALARLLAALDADRQVAATHRREAVSQRARLGLPDVPPGRRDVVARYLDLID